MTLLYHGTDRTLNLHVGLCLTSEVDRAREYGRNVYAVEVADGTCYGAVVVDGYDRDTNTAPGDRGEDFGGGVQWIEYDDESPYLKSHKTWRAVGREALTAIVSVALLDD